jgi:hypothetical protein
VPFPTVFEPSGLDPFLAAGLGVDHEDIYATDARGSGHHRKRRLYTTAPRRVTVGRILDPADAAAYHAWFEQTIVVGETHFVAWISNQGPGQLYYDACWLEPPQWTPLATPQGIHWRLEGALLLTGTGVEARPDDGVLEVEYEAALTGEADIVAPILLAVEYSAALASALLLAVEYEAALESSEPVVPSYLLIDADSKLSIGAGFNLRIG